MYTSRLVVGLMALASVVAVPAHGLDPATYDLQSEGSGWRAPCPAQGFDALIGPTEVRVHPRIGEWELALVLESVGRDGALTAAAPAGVSTTGPRAELHRGTLEEWYVNSARGLDQGFTLHERPDGKGMLVLELDLDGDLLARAAPDGQAIDLYLPGSHLAALRYGELAVEDAAGRRLAARLELHAGGGGERRLRVVVEDHDAVYPVTVDPLISGAAWSSDETDATGAVAWGDWDGDGDLDLAAGGWVNPIRVYENTGGGLSLAWSSEENPATVSLAWGDWDGDGDLDLAVGTGGQALLVYGNTGGALAPVWSSPVEYSAYGLAWGDWDGDGDLDLAVAVDSGPNVVYGNTGGDLTFAWTSGTGDTSKTVSVAWGDWDGDGDLDLAAGNNGGPNVVYVNTGGGLAASWASPETDVTRSVAWGDWDGDGDLDLAAGNDGPDRVYANTGGALTLAWSSEEPNRDTRSVAWGDSDGDGDLDLAAGNDAAANWVYENTGGALSSSAVWSSLEADNTTSVAWGDWDGDGDLDLAAGNHSQPNRVYVNVGASLGLAWSSSETEPTTSVAWGDWDGDGDLDLATASQDLDEPTRVYRNDGGGVLIPAWASPEEEGTNALAWGDWDGDGDLDLAVGNWEAPNRVYANGGGALSLAWSSSENDPTISLAWGDWDGDGDLDLAVGNAQEEGFVNRVYENTGGDLTLAWTSSEADDTGDVAWGDWDGDGDLDLAVGNRGGPNRVYANTGSTLTLSWSSTQTDATDSVAWGDWDGDGDLDLAVGNWGAVNRVYENTGGALSVAWVSVESENTTDVAWGDWDGDGDLDLAAGNTATNRVYANTGSTLALSWSSTETVYTRSVAWGDWDGDGDLDLATGGNGTTRAYPNGFLTRPGGLPETPTSPVLAGRPGGAAAAPFGHSSAGYLASPVTIPFTLVDEQSDPARQVVPEYSLAGGGQWLPATGVASPTTNLSTSPWGAPYGFVWDAAADGVFHEPDVAFRISVLWQAPDKVGGALQRGAMAAVSPPFMAGTPYLMANDFESGDTDGWLATGAGHMALTGGAAHSGSYGLQVDLSTACTNLHDTVLSGRLISGVLFAESCHAVVAGDGFVLAAGADATFVAGVSIVLQNGFSVRTGAALTARLDASLPPAVFVQDDSPGSESSYHARFFVNLDGATVGGGDEIEHFVAYDAEARPQLEVLVRSGPAMVLAVRDDTGAFHETSAHALSAGWNEVLVSWEAAADATPSLQVNAGAAEALTALDNNDARIEFVRWGAVGGTVSGSSGALALDDFTSWR